MSTASVSRYEAQVIIRDLIAFSYDSDAAFTTSLQKSAGNVTIDLNQRGEVSVSSSIDKMTFTLDQRQRARIGMDVQWVKVEFSSTDDGLFTYRISGRHSIFSFTFVGLVDLERLIKSCSGPLCAIARIINADTRAGHEAMRAFLD